MSAGSYLLDKVIDSFAPGVTANPAAGAYEITPDDMVKHYNETNGTSHKTPEDVNSELLSNSDLEGDALQNALIPDKSVWKKLDSQGRTVDVTDQVNKKEDALPYKPSTWLQRFGNNQAAQYQDRANADYLARPALEQSAHDIDLGIKTQDMGDYKGSSRLPIASLTPRQLAIRTKFAPSVESGEQANENTVRGIPQSNTTASLASNKAATERATNQATKDKLFREQGNIPLEVESEGKNLTTSILGNNRLIANAPDWDKLSKLTLNNSIDRALTVDPVVNKVAAGQAQATLENLPESNKLLRAQMQNELADALQKKIISPDFYKAQANRIKSDAAMSDQELQDMQHHLKAAHFKAALDGIISENAYNRRDNVKTAEDAQAKLAAIEGPAAVKRSPMVERGKDLQAQVGAGKAQFVNGMYKMLPNMDDKGGIPLQSGIKVWPKTTTNSTPTISQTVRTSNSGASKIKPVITNDVPPSKEIEDLPDDVWNQNRQVELDKLQSIVGAARDKSVPTLFGRSNSDVINDDIATQAGVPEQYVGSSNMKRAPRKVFGDMGGFSNPALSNKLNGLSAKQQVDLYKTMVQHLRENGYAE